MTYTTIHYPGSTITRAFGINARGDIVGNYVLDGVTYAFVAREAEAELKYDFIVAPPSRLKTSR